MGTASYTYKEEEWWNPWPLIVENRAWKNGALSNTVWNGIYYARARCTWGNGFCNVKFWWYPEGNYLVLDTDYTNWALVYGCDTWFGLIWTNQAWILSRTNYLTDTQISDAQHKLASIVPEWRYPHNSVLEKTTQGGSCTYG